MAHFGIESSAAFVIVVPCHGMVAIVFAAGVGGFIYFNQYMYIGVQVFVIVPFVPALPHIGQVPWC